MNKDRWIPVSERLPNNDERVLILEDNGFIEILTYFEKYGRMEGEEYSFDRFAGMTYRKKLVEFLYETDPRRAEESGFYFLDDINDLVKWKKYGGLITHWKPLPELPEEYEEE